MEGLDAQLQSLQSKDQAVLLDTVDELRRHGVNRYLSLPQIIVCGDQSSGKSSVLEAISGVHFPVNDGLCTRFTTEVILRRASENMATVKLIPYKDATPAHKQQLLNFKKPSVSHAEIPSLISEAKTIMGLTGGSTFSRDILQLEVSGPKLPHLTLVDLPGLIHSPNREQTNEDVRIPKELVEKYMAEPRSIVLAIVTAKNDTSNQVILKMAETADKHGVRTMGIITKPDCLIKGSPNEASFFKLASSKETSFKLGWHVVRNGDFNERNDPSFDRDEEEKKFLSSGIWKSLPASKRGVDALRTRLSHVLYQQILRELPSLLKEIENELVACKETLARLGTARDNPNSQRVYLTAVAERFHELVNAGAEGNYQDPFFRLNSSDLRDGKLLSDKQNVRLRANVRKAEKDFLESMQIDGHTYEIVTGTSKKPRVTARNFGGVINEERYLREVRVLLDHSKGKELPGTFSPLLVGDLFINQSKPWKDIAMSFVEDVWNLVKLFLDDVLAYVADESVRQAVLENVIDPAMDERLARLREKVIELHSPYASNYPATLNPRFVQNLESRKLAKWAENKTDGDDTNDDPDTYACRELLYLMQAYYGVALDVFVDNVANLGVENCLMNGLKNLLSARAVIEMDDKMLDSITSESDDVRELRTQTVEKLSSLRKSFDLCRRQARKLSLAERDSEVKKYPESSPSAKAEAVTEPVSTLFASTTISSPEKSKPVIGNRSEVFGAPSPQVNNSNTSPFGQPVPVASKTPSLFGQAVPAVSNNVGGGFFSQSSTVPSQNSGKPQLGGSFGLSNMSSNTDSDSGKSPFANSGGFVPLPRVPKKPVVRLPSTGQKEEEEEEE